MEYSSATRRYLAVAALAGAAFVGARWLGSISASGVAPMEPDAASAQLPEGQAAESSLRLPVATVASKRGEAPGVTFARYYFGPDAEAALEAMKEAGLDMDHLQPPAPEQDLRRELPEWFVLREDQRSETYRVNWGWPKNGATNEYLRTHFILKRDLQLDELQGLDALAAAHEPDVQQAADLYFESIDRAMAEKVQGGEFLLSPYIGWPEQLVSPEGLPFFRTTTKVGAGWVVRMGLEIDRFPDVIERRGGTRRAASVRDKDIAAMIAVMAP